MIVQRLIAVFYYSTASSSASQEYNQLLETGRLWILTSNIGAQCMINMTLHPHRKVLWLSSSEMTYTKAERHMGNSIQIIWRSVILLRGQFTTLGSFTLLGETYSFQLIGIIGFSHYLAWYISVSKIGRLNKFVSLFLPGTSQTKVGI